MGNTTDTIKKGIKDAAGAVKRGAEKGKDAAVRGVDKAKDCHLTHKSATSAKICVKRANLAKICVKLSLKKRQKGGGIREKMPTVAC